MDRAIKSFSSFALCALLDLFVYPTAEIRQVSGFNQNFVDHDRLEHESPLRSLGQPPNGRAMDLEGWPAMQVEVIPAFIYVKGSTVRKYYVELMFHSRLTHNLAIKAQLILSYMLILVS